MSGRCITTFPGTENYSPVTVVIPAWWQKRRMENFTAQFTQALPDHDEVADGWTVLAAAVRAKVIGDPSQMARVGEVLEESDFEKMVQIRDRVDTIVEDQATAEALKPWFSLYCKRPCFHDEYLQTFNRDNVTLVDTDGRGIERITAQGLVVKGKEYPLDCLIFATGFEVAASFSQRAGMEIDGVGGQSLTEKWQDGVATYHGLHTRGFPNMFVVSQTQAGMSPNFPHMLAEQTAHIAHIVSQCGKRGITAIEASEAAERDWVQTIVAMSEDRHKFLAECTPGYYNNEGRISEADARAAPYGGGPVEFVGLLKSWREAGDMAGLELNGPHALHQESDFT